MRGDVRVTLARPLVCHVTQSVSSFFDIHHLVRLMLFLFSSKFFVVVPDTFHVLSSVNMACFARRVTRCGMTQSHIDAFTVSRKAALAERAQRLERLHELEALCLEWPQARSKRRVGKLSRQHKWTDALYEHIRSDRPLLAGATLQVPAWWQSGGTVPPEPGALADHVMSSRQQALEGISTEAEAAAHAAEEATPKRKKSSARTEAVQFYFECRDFMVDRGLTAQASSRQLQHIAP